MLAACSTEDMPTPLGHDFEIDARLDIDDNGYYHLPLNEGENQTLHRFGVYITNIDINRL